MTVLNISIELFYSFLDKDDATFQTISSDLFPKSLFLKLLDVLDCLQCRALLLEWLVRNRLLGNKTENIV